MATISAGSVQRKKLESKVGGVNDMLVEQLRNVATEMRQPSTPTQTAQALEYISEISSELITIASAQNLTLLSHLLGMAKLECDQSLAAKR